MSPSSRFPSRGALVGLLVTLSSCPTLVTVPQSCGTGANGQVCMGQMQVPVDHAEKFRDGSRLAIDIVNSEAFATEVQRYMETALRDPRYATADWAGLASAEIVGGLRERLRGLQVTTYGGPWHYLRFRFADNVAQDGGDSGPIRINRWALPGWDGIDVGASITHEASHRAGMTHDSGRKECGPPYVLHAIMEKIARGSEWEWDEDNYCGSLRPTGGAVLGTELRSE